MSEQEITQTVAPPEPVGPPRRDAVGRSPAHHLHAARGARFRREGPFEVVATYGDLEAERRATRDGLAIADVTGRRMVDVRGPIDEILGRLPLAPDLRRARISSRWAILISAPDSGDTYLRAAEASASPLGMATDATSLYASFRLAGPRAGDLLARLTAFDVRSLEAGAATGTQLAKISAILIAIPAGDGVGRGYDVLVPSEYGRYAFETLLQAAHGLDARPCGWDALVPAPAGADRRGGTA